jgi:hypothetical protein
VPVCEPAVAGSRVPVPVCVPELELAVRGVDVASILTFEAEVPAALALAPEALDHRACPNPFEPGVLSARRQCKFILFPNFPTNRAQLARLKTLHWTST